jgi:hypothetical protein
MEFYFTVVGRENIYIRNNKKQSTKHVLCSQPNNGVAYVPDSEAGFSIQ